MCVSCWAPTPNTPLPEGREAGGLGGGSFDPVIPQVFAVPLPCLGRSQAGYWGTYVIKAGVCSLDLTVLGQEILIDGSSQCFREGV